MVALYTGDLRRELGRELMASLDKVISDNSGKHAAYYILVYSDWDHAQPGILRTKLILMLDRPPAMLGTLCIYVDNRKGLAKILHALPQDIPTEHVEMSDEGSKGVFDSAQENDSPIIY